MKEISQRIHNHINEQIDEFCVKYELTGIVANRLHYIDDSFTRLSALANALRAAQESGELKQPPRLLVLVDEYDRYSNKLMLENAAHYLASLKDKKSAASLVHPLRSLFETLKSIGGKLNRYRTLVVGLTPVAIADASGANVWKNISSAAHSAICAASLRPI